MKRKVWKVRMGNLEFPAVTNDTTNVCAMTLIDAISTAEKTEQKLCAQMTDDEGEEFTPDKAIAVEFLCEIDD